MTNITRFTRPRERRVIPMVRAVQEIRALRGETRPHLMRCDDGDLYIVKFRHNPAHSRVLANELVGTLLTRSLGLPCPPPAIVEIGQEIADQVQSHICRVPGDSALCQPGLHFGSRYMKPLRGLIYDYLPTSALNIISNGDTFVGMLAADKWLGNTDARQLVLGRFRDGSSYEVLYIDYARCFNGDAWTFPDRREDGSYVNHGAYHRVTGWCDFEPWLSRIENMNAYLIQGVAELIPDAWYAGDRHALSSLVTSLADRRTTVRALIASFCALPCAPFPNWESEEPFLSTSRPKRRIM